MIKRGISLILCAVLTMGLFCGCGGSSGGKNGNGDTVVKDMGGYEFKIAAWWDGTPNDSSESGARAMALQKEAEKKYNCKVTYLFVPLSDIVQKLTASVMAGDPFADIVWLEANTAIPQMALFDFGAVASIITASASGMRASGKPSCKAASTHDFVMTIAFGYASPMSSAAITSILRHML